MPKLGQKWEEKKSKFKQSKQFFFQTERLGKKF